VWFCNELFFNSICYKELDLVDIVCVISTYCSTLALKKKAKLMFQYTQQGAVSSSISSTELGLIECRSLLFSSLELGV